MAPKSKPHARFVDHPHAALRWRRLDWLDDASLAPIRRWAARLRASLAPMTTSLGAIA